MLTDNTSILERLQDAKARTGLPPDPQPQDASQALAYMHQLLGAMTKADGHELILAHDASPMVKVRGQMSSLSPQKLHGETTRALAMSLMNERQRAEFDRQMECNFTVTTPSGSRFRVSAYLQQSQVAMAIRAIADEAPSADLLGLPSALREQVMRCGSGLILVAGAIGSGRATTMAALVDHRNTHGSGHIVTIEDPIEVVHRHKRCVVTQREVGVDVQSWEAALKNATRQAPELIVMGEIRDRNALEHAIHFAETGHLCLAKLTAGNVDDAIERILQLVPEQRQAQLLMDLSAHLRCIAAQRLVRTQDGRRRAAVEVLINTPSIADTIFRAQFPEIRQIMDRSRSQGMRTLDWALFELYTEGHIAYEEALRNADSANELRLNIRLRSRRGEPPTASRGQLAATSA